MLRVAKKDEKKPEGAKDDKKAPEKKDSKPAPKESPVGGAGDAPAPEAPPAEIPLPTEAPADQLAAVSEPALPMEAPAGPGMISPATARFMTADMGPFVCSNCEYWGGNSCVVVQDAADGGGICSLFEPVPQADPMAMGLEAPMEAPIAGPAPEGIA